jgi:hypothetical protein
MKEETIILLSWPEYNKLIRFLGPDALPTDFIVNEKTSAVVRIFYIEINGKIIKFFPEDLWKKYQNES